MLKTLINISLFIVTFSTSLILNGQQVLIELERDSILIGEQIKLNYGIGIPVGESPKEINWSILEDALPDQFMVLDSVRLESTQKDFNGTKLDYYAKSATITCFDSGYYKVSPIFFLYQDQELETEEQKVYVNTVAVDLEADPAPTKSIYKPPFDWAGLWRKAWPWLLLLALIPLAIYAYKKLKKEAPEPEPEPVVEKVVPAHQIAISALRELKEKQLLLQGKEKEFQSELTGILRTYLENRYELSAMEQPTADTLQQLRVLGLSNELVSDASQVLNVADIVKFAKGKLSQQINEDAYTKVAQFVMKTKLIPPPEDE